MRRLTRGNSRSDREEVDLDKQLCLAADPVAQQRLLYRPRVVRCAHIREKEVTGDEEEVWFHAD
jgi:hypothetical protein